ncbi:transcriptional regulator, LysR family [Rhodoferax sp. OV413]|uniref:HTH-type transcriptional regulator ArgP n=1 Tax=Rhodoferax sp. OV413 TaxID=1855285 RepID=UPI00088E9B49|nr:HTH-type transcriptional regulator ArgP [Rhodoferax sp. OV413]SDP74550.1 transcriptional regulator, LysR family [Rhodoferax sp. OV413]
MLDVKQLEALAAVLEEGGFGPAAKALNLTLAAVSLRIKGLEAALGQRLLVRGKTVRATPAGQTLLAHVKQLRLMEADLVHGLPSSRAQGGADSPWQSLGVAVNADSLASWFLPGVAATLARYRLLLDIAIHDQDHTLGALQSGDVIGCVSALAQPMRGCLAEPLGVMRYRAMVAPALLQKCRTRAGAVSVHRLLAQPALIFDRKDALQDAFLAQHFGLASPQYPRHFVPAVDAFESALEYGMGWGMVPEQFLARRVGRLPLEELLPGRTVDVALYWHHWEREPVSAQRLTQAVKAAAQTLLAERVDAENL